MKSWNKYIVIYKTNALEGEQKIVLDQVKIEVFDGPKKFKIPRRLARIIPQGEEKNFMTSAELEVRDGKFITFEARSKSNDFNFAKNECERAIEAAVAAVSISHTSDIFDMPIYTGWIEDESRINVEAWVKITERQALIDETVRSTDKNIEALGDEARERFTLMSRLYNKALIYDPGEEKFLLMWMILEIFPMMGQAQYHPIATYLSPILKKDPATIAGILEIKKMHSIRSKLLHSGRFELNYEEVSSTLQRIELIIRTVMREMAGLDYDGSLNEYFK